MQPVENLQLDLSVAALDATYRTFFSTDGLGGPFNESLRDNHLPRSPAWTATLGLQNTWRMPVGELTVRGEMYHTAHYYFREFNREGDRQDAYTIGNAFITLTTLQGWFARLYCKNVTDKLYIQELISSEVAGDREGNYAPPRTFGADIGYKF